MTAYKNEPQALIGYFIVTQSDFVDARRLLGHSAQKPIPRASASQLIERLTIRDSVQPTKGISRHSVSVPRLNRLGAGIRKSVLGKFKIAITASKRADDAPAGLPNHSIKSREVANALTSLPRAAGFR